MTPLDKLVAHFEKFPGTGIRQAKRFAFHVLSLKPEQISELAHLITTLPQSVTTCTNCYRFFSENNTKLPQCAICRDVNRDRGKLLIVARDSDIESIERSGVYDGLYFVLGGTVSLLANPHDQQRIRSGALKATITALLATDTLREIILAFAINPDGENTGRFIEATLKESLQNTAVTITHLGRGLSTGSELEYADPETIKNALASRG
jgi:recombination protein RecR